MRLVLTATGDREYDRKSTNSEEQKITTITDLRHLLNN